MHWSQRKKTSSSQYYVTDVKDSNAFVLSCTCSETGSKFREGSP